MTSGTTRSPRRKQRETHAAMQRKHGAKLSRPGRRALPGRDCWGVTTSTTAAPAREPGALLSAARRPVLAGDHNPQPHDWIPRETARRIATDALAGVA